MRKNRPLKHLPRVRSSVSLSFTINASKQARLTYLMLSDSANHGHLLPTPNFFFNFLQFDLDQGGLNYMTNFGARGIKMEFFRYDMKKTHQNSIISHDAVAVAT